MAVGVGALEFSGFRASGFRASGVGFRILEKPERRINGALN